MTSGIKVSDFPDQIEFEDQAELDEQFDKMLNKLKNGLLERSNIERWKQTNECKISLVKDDQQTKDTLKLQIAVYDKLLEAIK